MDILIRPLKAKLFFFFVLLLTVPSVLGGFFLLFTKTQSIKQFFVIFFPLLLILLLFRFAYLLYKKSFILITTDNIKISQISFSSKEMNIPGKHFFLKITCITIDRKNSEGFYFSYTPSNDISVEKTLFLRPLYLTTLGSTLILETCFYTKPQIEILLSTVKENSLI